jgi:hypothetical protein
LIADAQTGEAAKNSVVQAKQAAEEAERAQQEALERKKAEVSEWRGDERQSDDNDALYIR